MRLVKEREWRLVNRRRLGRFGLLGSGVRLGFRYGYIADVRSVTIRADQDWRSTWPVCWEGVDDDVFNPIGVVT